MAVIVQQRYGAVAESWRPTLTGCSPDRERLVAKGRAIPAQSAARLRGRFDIACGLQEASRRRNTTTLIRGCEAAKVTVECRHKAPASRIIPVPGAGRTDTLLARSISAAARQSSAEAPLPRHDTLCHLRRSQTRSLALVWAIHHPVRSSLQRRTNERRRTSILRGRPGCAGARPDQ